jgi:hypothetical protein
MVRGGMGYGWCNRYHVFIKPFFSIGIFEKYAGIPASKNISLKIRFKTEAYHVWKWKCNLLSTCNYSYAAFLESLVTYLDGIDPYPLIGESLLPHEQIKITNHSTLALFFPLAEKIKRRGRLEESLCASLF